MPSMMKTTTLLGLLVSAVQVSAHGFVQNIVVDGTSFTGYLVTKYPYESNPPDSIGWTESETDLGFVSPADYAGGDIICHKAATNAKATATVSAGGTVTMEWNTWPSTHKGPVIDYLASCKGACATVDKTALEFFKIDEKGLISDTTSPGTWASDNLISNNNSWVITIPTGIASGPYVLRHEIIALHSAGSIDGAQNYPQCINLEVTGGGSDVPAGTLGEALYKDTDPGISINIYTTGLSYTIPGPTLYNGGSGAAATTKAPAVAATSAVASTPTTLATSTITKAPATTSAATASSDPDTCEL